jgi:GxxExxY protein
MTKIFAQWALPGLDVKQQHPIKVFDEDGTLIGDYYADLLVDGWLIVELRTAKALADEHVAQVLGYLKSARLEHGLLINFGTYRFEMRKFAWSQDVVRRKSKPTFLLSAVSAFFAFFAVQSTKNSVSRSARKTSLRRGWFFVGGDG